jgi:acyl dehydratase
VTGRDQPLAHPNLVCDVAIGQSTGPTQRVVGNLFYRGLVLMRPVFIGDTLRTTTEVVGLKQNRAREGASTGLVALRIRTENQDGDPVLDFYRCPMIPLRDPDARTGHADRFDEIPQELDPQRVRKSVPRDWDYRAARDRLGGWDAAVPEAGVRYEIGGRETVTAAPELARLTLNVAMTHTDAGAGVHGRRLVYGGHTIAVAAAHASRAVSSMVTIVAWRSCEHLGPVFEGDILSSELTVGAMLMLEGTDAMLADLRALVRADRDPALPPDEVLDWRFLALVVPP